MQLLGQTEGDRAQIYEFFRTNLEQLDKALLRALPELLTELVHFAKPALIAAVSGVLGSLIAEFSLGDRRLNMELCIAAYQQSLQVMTREAMPVEWAASMNNLAIAYKDRIRGDRAQNLEDAIAVYQSALQVRTREAMPVEFPPLALENKLTGNIQKD